MDVDMVCLNKQHQQQQSTDKNTKKMNFINRLDNKLLEKIFMMLSFRERITMEKVCPKFKGASLLTWKNFKKFEYRKKYYPRMTKTDFIKILIKSRKYLEELHILQGVCDSKIILFVGNHCKNLTTLKFEYNEDLKTNDIEDYFKAFKELNKLEKIHIIVLRNERQEDSHFRSEIINGLSGESLIEIKISCESSTNSLKSCPIGMVPINFNLNKFKNLRCLSLEKCSIHNSVIEEISEQTPLTYLYIKKSFFEEKLLTFNKLPNLQYIDIRCYYQKMNEKYTLSTINSIVMTCKELKYLDIGSYIGTCNLRKIPLSNWMNLQNLENLIIAVDSIDDLSNKLVKYCKELKKLCVSVTCEKTITENALNNLSKLEKLEDFKLHMMEISVESIMYISNNFKKLKILLLPKCTEVQSSTDDLPHSTASVFDELSNLQYLEYLYLLNGEQIQDSTIIAIANKCTDLKTLIIKNCPKITETSLDALAGLKSFKILNISGNDNITDKSTHKLSGLRILKRKKHLVLNRLGVNKLTHHYSPPTEWYNVFSIDNITPDGRIKSIIDTKQERHSYEHPFSGKEKRKKLETPLSKRLFKKLDKITNKNYSAKSGKVC